MTSNIRPSNLRTSLYPSPNSFLVAPPHAASTSLRREENEIDAVRGRFLDRPEHDLILDHAAGFRRFAAQAVDTVARIYISQSLMSSGPGLESLVDQTISVITNDGRNIVGILKGFDQATNIILDESHERVYSTKEGVQQLVLGLYIIRGDNISVVGELDEELDANLDLSKLRAHPLKPVIH
ncbi:hypothetical protein HPP92_021482 [Vanilla planifolia]|uniref:U6 snRNA-associated Sm-like protein LSm8 n=2 Tax=Petrosaviidae TaxID=1437197 RepID=A0A835Q2L9_VANPL|nr:hypothetical protein HPP92_021482 [Vanilla planifolia]